MTKDEARQFMEDQESTFMQWKYLLQILGMIVGVLLILTLKGPGNKESVIGIKKCDPGDWGLLAALVIFALVMEFVAILVAKSEYEFKQQIGWQFTEDDYKYSLSTVWQYPVITFIGTFTAILVGFSPAFIYVPFFIT